MALELHVRVTPNAKADRIEGAGEDDAGRRFLKVRVRAVPEDGKANKAVAALVAKALGLPKSAVTLAVGGKSRLKRLAIEGEADTPRRIEELMNDER